MNFRSASLPGALVSMRRSRFLTAVLLVGLLLRVGFVLVRGDTSDPKKIYEFGFIAANMVAGAGFTMHIWYETQDPERFAIQQRPPAFEGAYMPPMNVGIVYLAFAAFGVNTPASMLALMLFYAVAGAATPIAAYFTTRRFASEGAARLAAAGLVFFPPAIFAVVTFSGSVLFQSGALIVIGLAIGAAHEPARRRFLLLGLSAGLMAFLRSEFFMLGMLIIAATTLLSYRRHGRSALLPGLASLALMLLTVAPWTARNYAVFGRFLPVISHPWSEIWRGNNDYAMASSFDPEGEGNWFEREHYRPVTRRLDSLRYDGTFELAADSILRDEVRAYVARNPGRALSLALQRVILLWTVDTNHPAARNPLYIALIVPTLLLILTGFVLSVRLCRRRGEWGPVVIYALFFGFTSAMVAITHIQPRHQVYLVTVAFPLVGIALERFLAGWHGLAPGEEEIGEGSSRDRIEPSVKATA